MRTVGKTKPLIAESRGSCIDPRTGPATLPDPWDIVLVGQLMVSKYFFVRDEQYAILTLFGGIDSAVPPSAQKYGRIGMQLWPRSSPCRMLPEMVKHSDLCG